MNFVKIILILFTLIFSVQALAEGGDSCLENAMTEREMKQCAYIDFEKADAELNRVYKKIREVYKKDKIFLKKLKIAQLAWIKLRDADLEMRYPHEPSYYGSMWSMCEASARTELTLQRVEYLKKWLVEITEPDLCLGSMGIMKELYISDISKKFTSLEKYLEEFKSFELDGGNLFCDDSRDGKRTKFNNCKEFSILRKNGCFGYTTPEIKHESYYANNCKKINAMQKGKMVTKHFFDFSSPNWWKPLPAEIIPLPGGIYSDDSLIHFESELKKWQGKFLGDLNLENKSSKSGVVELILNTDKELDCGEIHDLLHFSAVLLADFDNDNTAELLIEGYRMNISESCFLGSGNSLGSNFSVIVKKSNFSEMPSVLSILNQ